MQARNINITNKEVYTTICNLIGDGDRTELNALLYSIADRKLVLKLESAINSLVGEIGDKGFIVGWQCAKQPELLIFDTEEE